jgi:hypothetical protein
VGGATTYDLDLMRALGQDPHTNALTRPLRAGEATVPSVLQQALDQAVVASRASQVPPPVALPQWQLSR